MIRIRRGSRPDQEPPAEGVPAPAVIEIGPRHLRVGDMWAATLVVTGYPSEVGAGWLEPLTAYPGRLDVSLHIEPVPPAVAADRLRRQRARLESARRAGAERGRLDDPDSEAAAEDARDLAYRVARGEGRLFRLALVLTVYAGSEHELDAEVATVRGLCSSMLLVAQPASYRMLDAWISSLPLALDRLGQRRTVDTPALAGAFPMSSPDLAPVDPASTAPPAGVLLGENTASVGLVLWDRWAQDNYNSVILGRSGGGKSYLVKLDALRSTYQGVQVIVVDPEDEYTRLANAVGGTVIRLGQPGVRINPLDLPASTSSRADGLTRRALFLHTFLAVLLGEPLTSAERAALDHAVLGAYGRAGITADPRTWNRPAPLLGDLATLLAAGHDPAGRSLAARLTPFTEGAHAALFTGPTTHNPAGRLAVYSLRDVDEELKPVATLLTLDAIWRRVTNPDQRAKRLVVVDEAWSLLQSPAGARWLWRMAKAARKHWAALTLVTQDADDVLSSELGRAVVNNAATQILLRQATGALPAVTHTFGLSDGERTLLGAAPRGTALLVAGHQRVAFHALASPAEHELITTDPAEHANNPGPEPDPAQPDRTDAPPLYPEIDDPEGDLL